MDCGIGESVDSSFSDDLGNFECSICFELPEEPIVTRCGHLYCWPCLCQWLRLHSYSSDCPICKATIHEEKLIPIYGRGKPKHDPRSRRIPGVTVPNQPAYPRPQTAPYIAANSVQENDLDPLLRFMPMAAARVGHATLSTVFGALPLIFNLQFHELLHDGTAYGTTSRTSDSFFPSLFHRNFVHGFNHLYHLHHPMEWKPTAWKGFYAVLAVLSLCILSLSLISLCWGIRFAEGN